MRWRDLWPFSRRSDAAAAPPPASSSARSDSEPAILSQPPRAQYPARATRHDWTNAATGMGMAGVDPALSTYYLAQTGITDEEAVALHRTDPIARKLINKPIDEAFRGGFELEIVEDDAARDAKGNRAGVDARVAHQLKRDVKARWKALGVLKAVRKAWKWSRREGGSAILLGSVDLGAAAGLATPIPPEGRVNLKWLRVLRARDFWPDTYYADIAHPKFDEPETWMVTMGRNGRGTATLRVHESRMVVFEGEKVVDEAYPGQLHPGLGDSVLLPFYRALRRYGTSMAGIEKLLSRFGQPWMKIQNLAELTGADKQGDLTALLDAYEYAASVFNVRVVDGADEYGTSAPTVTGLPDLLQQVRGELQAASDMPLTILFGDLVGGLGDNGTAVKRDWLDSVAALRDEHAVPPLEYITGLIVRGIGNGKLPGEWNVVGKPLWQPTARERADIDKIEMEIDRGYLGEGVVLPEHVMRREPVAKRYGIDQTEIDALQAARARMTSSVRTPGGDQVADPDEAEEPDPEDPGEDDEPPEPGA